MKKCLLGIGLLLFAILLIMCSTGMELYFFIIGFIGLFLVFLGAVSKDD